MEAAKYYMEALTHWDRVNSAYKRNEASRDEARRRLGDAKIGLREPQAPGAGRSG